MANVLVEESYLQGIANAIRSKNGTLNTYTPAQMEQAISNIPTGGGGMPSTPLDWLLYLHRNNSFGDFNFVGVPITVTHSVYGNIVMEVAHRGTFTDENDNSFSGLVLMSKDAITELPYDGQEAIWANTSLLPAGNYNFQATVAYGKLKVGYYNFTLSSDVPANSLFVGFPNVYDDEPSGTPVKIYDSFTSTTEIQSATMTYSSSAVGTTLCQISEAGNTSNNITPLRRFAYGSNNWAQSNLRQFLNSESSAGQVFTQQHSRDRVDASFLQLDGFMKGLDSDFKNLLVSTKRRYVSSNVGEESGYTVGGSYQCSDKIFIPTRLEVQGDKELSSVSYGIGSKFKYFDIHTDRRKKKIGTSTNISYQLSTPDRATAHKRRLVNTSNSGSVVTDNANNSYGVVVCCVIA